MIKTSIPLEESLELRLLVQLSEYIDARVAIDLR
jgi:hypothetical protein